MKQEEQIERLLLEKKYQDLSSQELSLIKAIGWSQSDYQAEQIVRQEIKNWATAPVPPPNTLPLKFPNPNPNPSPFPIWAIAACWLLSLASAAFIGFQFAQEKPVELVEHIVYQTDTVYLPSPAIPIAAQDEIINPAKASKSTLAIAAKVDPIKSLAVRDSISELNLLQTSRSMAADKDIMKLTSRVW